MTDSNSTTKAILFDLDNTLFDHHHSLECAIAAIQEEYPDQLGDRTDLIDRYNTALQTIYDKLLRGEIRNEEADALKVQLFYADLGLPEPSPQEITHFRAVYKTAYRANRRATPGSVESLTRLHKHGYRIGIITNGQTEDQIAKVEAIGLSHLVDKIFTSEEAGCCKPDRRIFLHAMDKLLPGLCPDQIYMVGDSIDSDIKGALDVGMRAILYSPSEEKSAVFTFGSRVPVITFVGNLLEHLCIPRPHFEQR